jgi:hypothetical protein
MWPSPIPVGQCVSDLYRIELLASWARCFFLHWRRAFFAVPTEMAVTLVAGGYFASLIVAPPGILARRRTNGIQAEFLKSR